MIDFIFNKDNSWWYNQYGATCYSWNWLINQTFTCISISNCIDIVFLLININNYINLLRSSLDIKILIDCSANKVQLEYSYTDFSCTYCLFAQLAKRISLAISSRENLNPFSRISTILAVLSRVYDWLFYLGDSIELFVSKWRPWLALLSKAFTYSELSFNSNRLCNTYLKLSISSYFILLGRALILIIYRKDEFCMRKAIRKYLLKGMNKEPSKW